MKGRRNKSTAVCSSPSHRSDQSALNERDLVSRPYWPLGVAGGGCVLDLDLVHISASDPWLGWGAICMTTVHTRTLLAPSPAMSQVHQQQKRSKVIVNWKTVWASSFRFNWITSSIRPDIPLGCRNGGTSQRTSLGLYTSIKLEFWRIKPYFRSVL